MTFQYLHKLLKPKKETIAKGMEIEKALSIIERQMKLNGYRERTLNEYNLIFNQFTEATRVKYLEEITVAKIYEWLDSMNVLI